MLQCTASILKEQIKLCLSCEGFGNRLCFLETTSNAQVERTPFHTLTGDYLFISASCQSLGFADERVVL